jgi:O-antigen/teichoic acid export membrane protein
MLSKERFGEVVSVLSLVFLFVLPAHAVQTFLTREISQSGSTSVRALFTRFRKLVVVAGIVVVCLGLIGAPFVRAFLKLPSVVPALLLPPVIALGFVLPTYRGWLQGRRRFRALAGNVAAEAGLRLVLSILLVAAGYATAGVLGGFVVAMVFALGLGHYLAQPELRQTSPKAVEEILSGFYDFLLIFLGLAFLNSLFNLDVILARHYLPGQSAGDYAAISLVARILFYLTAAVSGVVLASDQLSSPTDRQQVVAKGLLICAGLPLAGELLFVFIGGPLVGLVFGARYAVAAGLLPVLGLGMVAVAATNVLMYFLMALRRRSWIFLLMLTMLIEVGLIGWRHSGIWDIGEAFAIASGVGLAGLAIAVIPSVRAPRSATA